MQGESNDVAFVDVSRSDYICTIVQDKIKAKCHRMNEDNADNSRTKEMSSDITR